MRPGVYSSMMVLTLKVLDLSLRRKTNPISFSLSTQDQSHGNVEELLREYDDVCPSSFEKSSDGFYLVNMDLVLRGPGDLLGKKQSGHLPEFPVVRLEVD
ncbi:trifunctional UDP-glucose 4 6-dehydratase/UDP-4-keto-6-deoxy-d-glucose 3 5-epimerase/UDP-4-keto-l-rhamnose-reductase rhm3 [Phtheirospermum japonicum]|uniref:Trifunctional UDP-glucose 4 6-dehydratase/UDP-4-keto-6-deoxy-d-glucose 3 5-epimerase/UDP-4-keto-l-rhamnose-reductase rhm3 n=1 Tax=Phtheirospermum japonicum TaxID=374723 RepID=A0A830CQM2_9LAMI|nr:trifunctional UDP-glucose 4 6-dehydratase/UDP-4-keto-6-deoxy-d-glucose 3 5-epimerase/UDP-4-keto-l-rhamnose-reductase rhm3 [Phtheirospermum japonicum]